VQASDAGATLHTLALPGVRVARRVGDRAFRVAHTRRTAASLRHVQPCRHAPATTAFQFGQCGTEFYRILLNFKNVLKLMNFTEL